MTLLVLSFFAGVLTVAAPCILPLLPVIVGGSLTGNDKTYPRPWLKPAVITASLAISVIIFTLLLKATTALLGVPLTVWSTISGLIVLLFGIHLFFPVIWEKVMLASGIYNKSNQLMGLSSTKTGPTKDIVLGASLGPVFNSCSPTYALIVAAILPQSFLTGLSYLTAYAIGLATVLLLIAFAGQSLVDKMHWLSNPSGVFRRVIGVLFVIVGISVIFGFDKQFQAYILEEGWYDPVRNFELKL